MKILEIAITILICLGIIFVFTKQSKKIQQQDNSVVIKNIKKLYKQGELQL